VKQQWRVMGSGGEMRWIRSWWWWGSAFASVRQERGLGSKSNETEQNGLVLGCRRSRGCCAVAANPPVVIYCVGMGSGV